MAHQRLEFELLLDELFELLLLLELDELLLDVFELEFDELLFDVFELVLLDVLLLEFDDVLLEELFELLELLLLDEPDGRERTRSTGPSSDEPKLLTPRLPSSLEFDELLLEELFDELLALFELLLLLEFDELLLDELFELLELLLFDELLDELFDEFELLLPDEFDDPCDDPRERTFRPPSPEKRLLPLSRTPTRRNSAGKLPTVRSKGSSAGPRSRKGATFCACTGAPASKPAMAAIRTLSLPFMIFISCRKTVPGKRQAAAPDCFTAGRMAYWRCIPTTS